MITLVKSKRKTTEKMMIKNKFEIKYKDIDPDTGKIISEKQIAETDNKTSAIWVVSSLNYQWFSEEGPNDPNRIFFYTESN